MSDLHLSSSQVAQIRAEAERAYPEECCGIMLGRDLTEPAPRRVVDRLLPATNSFESGERYHRFSITPQMLLQAERTAAADGLLVVGFYHSHPDHPARPSQYDAEHGWPFYSYVIINVTQGKAGLMTSWLLDQGTPTFGVQAVVTEGGEAGGSSQAGTVAAIKSEVGS
jgi:proteasome lid subunit RPN8/RPN11